MTDFESQETHFQFNPRLGAREAAWLRDCKFPGTADVGGELSTYTTRSAMRGGHIWLASSGTTTVGALKVIALSKRAFLVAAAAANTHLQSTDKDVWLNPLPLFHVGGIAVHARAFLSGARVISPEAVDGLPAKWNAPEFVTTCSREGVTLASLVPTQVFDLVKAKLRAPGSVRAVLVGGGALAPQLYFEARKLGWPLLPTYGMTEVCSQVATASLQSLDGRDDAFPTAEILGHIEARISDDGFLQLRSEALFTAMGLVNDKGYTPIDGMSERWYTTGDFCSIIHSSRNLKFIGRAGDLIKVGGELVNLAKLRDAFAVMQPPMPFAFLSETHGRLGERVVAVTETAFAAKFAVMIETFNKAVAPFERVRGIYALRELPQSDLGKVKVSEIKEIILV